MLKRNASFDRGKRTYGGMFLVNITCERYSHLLPRGNLSIDYVSQKYDFLYNNTIMLMSVIIPVYNEEKFIGEILKCVKDTP